MPKFKEIINIVEAANQELDLSGCLEKLNRRQSEQLRDAILKKASSITSINLSNNQLFNIDSSKKKISSHDYKKAYSIMNNIFIAISNCHYLKKLYLSNCNLISDASTSSFVMGLPSSHILFRTLEELPHLEILDISYNYFYHSQSKECNPFPKIHELYNKNIPGLVNIVRINLSGCKEDEISFGGVISILEHTPNIEEIMLDDFTLSTDDARMLKRTLSKLAKLQLISTNSSLSDLFDKNKKPMGIQIGRDLILDEKSSQSDSSASLAKHSYSFFSKIKNKKDQLEESFIRHIKQHRN